jgi:succinyl-CoA synthetase alpha subunit
MATEFRVVPKEYRDSVSLMQLSALLAKLPGVEQASAVMATENNLTLLNEAGFGVSATGATAVDLLIVVRGEQSALAGAIDEAVKNLTRQVDSGTQESAAPKPRSIQMALAETGVANMALISTPGEYAAPEAMKALHLGLNVMLFSDNVSEEDELRLKRAAQHRNLIVMGPDCGTAIINGVPLAFANVVKRGPIGAIGASGTGLQEVTVLVDRLGLGVSQAIGTGGRDLHSKIGGISMSKGLRDLAADPATRVIVLISKPPAADVAERMFDQARNAGKPVVVCFLGADPRKISGGGVHGARTLEDAARAAVDIARGELPRQSYADVPPPLVRLPPLGPGQRYIRGLYSGGTFCYEAALLLDERLADVYSNTPVRPQGALEDLWRSHHHTLLDLGDDAFTRGRPHPMIDFRLRNERIAKEAEDPETAVILVDVVLGYGSNADPAGELVPALRRARDIAARDGRNLAFVGHVCGTEGDPQGLDLQTSALTQAGMVLTQSNAQAVRLAASMVADRAPGRR